MTEDEMVGWHHQFHGHEFKKTPGDGEGQKSLACCSPWGHKELDMTDQHTHIPMERHHWKDFIGMADAEAEAPVLWPPDAKSQLIRKDSDAGKD